MNKNTIAILSVIAILGVSVAVFLIINGSKNSNTTQPLVTNQVQNNTLPENSQTTPNNGPVTTVNTVVASIEDLKVGDEIGVTGTPNADGSLTALNIRIGAMPESGNGQQVMIVRDRQNGGTGGTMFRGDSQQSAQAGSTNARPGMVRGEILEIDESTITLALKDGGSQLIFYTAQTAVSKIVEE